MDFTTNTVFNTGIQIPEEAKIVWISDIFLEDYVGGAELTSEALIQSCPLEIFKLHTKDVTMELLQKGQQKFWIFGNFAGLDLNIIPAIVANMKYSILEYDYKYCKYRSPEKHKNDSNEDCDCHESTHGKLIAGFYRGATHLWWMAEKQMDHYHKLFPFLRDEPIRNTVLSSVFSKRTLAEIKILREKAKDTERKGWIVLGSNSWIKGFENAETYCKDNGLDYEVVWNLPYEKLLQKLSMAEGFVYKPLGRDTSPRMCTESKLLGCKLVLNEYVQHKDEEWFNPKADEDDEITQIEQYLYAAPEWFWNGIKAIMEYKPTVSGYTTTRNCISQKYPFEQSINSMLNFCNEVIVMDGQSSDGTWEKLQELAEKEPKIKVYQSDLDWEHARFAVWDGKSKDLARQKCSMDFCWQQDSDEIVHKEDGERILEIMSQFPPTMDLLALPVIEYWGGKDKVRFDINLWKWRISKNKKYIGHGIPKQLRVNEGTDNMYAKLGTDGCDYIHRETGDLIPCANFMTPDIEMLRRQGQTDENAHKMFQQWVDQIVNTLPTVFHFSWWDIERKIHTYKNYWGNHWQSLYNLDVEDAAENNMFFDAPWSEVTDEMIKERSKELGEKCGGWIFHSKWDGMETKHITCPRPPPKHIED